MRFSLIEFVHYIYWTITMLACVGQYIFIYLWKDMSCKNVSLKRNE